ncbi:MAG: hypothetical protein ACFB10_12510 [Salibacteraceae bacterium]
MNNTLNLGVVIFTRALMIVGAILCVLVMVTSDETTFSYPWVGSFITYALVLLAVASFSWIATFITAIISNPAKIKSILIWIVGLGLVFGIGYALSTGDDYQRYINKTTEELLVDEVTAHLSGTGIIMFYVLLGGAVLSIVFSSVTRFIR